MKKYKKLLLIAAVLTGFLMLLIGRGIVRERKYEQAISLVFDGAYEEAEAIFGALAKNRNYQDSYEYIDYCWGLRAYDEGNLSFAYLKLSNLHLTGLTPEQEKKIEDLRAVLETDYEAKQEKKREAERAEISEEVPFVGMSERMIGSTSLGAPSSDVMHNSELINGEQYQANLYTFWKNGAVIFTARCVRGIVTEVWDTRDHPAAPYTRPEKTKAEQDDDPYNVNDYYSEEDFYEDHYDDFFDFEDAEDYFNEHRH